MRMPKWLSDLFEERLPPENVPLAPTMDLDLALKDAEELLSYVAEAGIDVAPDAVQTIVTAIAASRTGATAWGPDNAAALLAAIAKVAAKASPVTAETLRASRDAGQKKIRTYELLGFPVLIVIISLSFLSFVTNGLSKSINTDIDSANKLVVTLHADSPTPSPAPKGTPLATAASISRLEDLQEFAATARSIKRDALKLHGYLFRGGEPLPDSIKKPDYELPADLQDSAAARKAMIDSTKFYQNVRSFAKGVQKDTDLYYAALGTVILTILYALLGAFAYLLRLFSSQVSKHTFSRTYSASARIFIAAIAGLIIGLFNAFTVSTGASLSPLALAFLAGYAADGFFASLEGLSFKKPA
jgi:hypothetical protein